MESEIASIIREAVEGTIEVLEAAFKEVGLPPLTQEEKRAMFEEAAQSEEGMAALKELLGPEEFARQTSLGVKRRMRDV